MYLTRRFAVSDRLTYFKHVRPQDHLIVRLKMIGIIFHKRIASLHAAAHYFHGANECCRFPISFCSESISFTHQPLNGYARQLKKAMKIFKCIGEPFKISFPKESAKTGFYFCRLAQ